MQGSLWAGPDKKNLIQNAGFVGFCLLISIYIIFIAFVADPYAQHKILLTLYFTKFQRTC